jgi:hypothetical protein
LNLSVYSNREISDGVLSCNPSVLDRKKGKENCRISLLLTEPGRISIEWDVIEKEIFPKEKTLVQKQRETTKEV